MESRTKVPATWVAQQKAEFPTRSDSTHSSRYSAHREDTGATQKTVQLGEISAIPPPERRSSSGSTRSSRSGIVAPIPTRPSGDSFDLAAAHPQAEREMTI